jgi:glutathione peroxidase
MKVGLHFGGKMKSLLVLMMLMTGSAALAANAHSIYDFKVKTIDGKEISLANYKGKSLLIVNTASKCGYTPQYEGLEALYNKYKEKGVVVLGFPSNDFNGQEPGTNAEIQHFCKAKYNVDFPMFEKGVVKGEQKQPLFTYLTENAPVQGEIKWNFEKFLIDPTGKIVSRFRSAVKPSDAALTAAVEKAIAMK